MSAENEFLVGGERNPINEVPIPPDIAIASVALKLAMEFHKTTICSDGVMYQQYKMEGRNLVPLEITMVFETAEQIERHLLSSPERMVRLLRQIDADGEAQPVGDEADGPASTVVPDGTP